MKKSEKIIILILLIITIIVVGIFIYTRTNNNGGTDNNEEITQNNGLSTSQIPNKEIDQIQVSNIAITDNGGDVTVTANVTNNTELEKDEFTVKIKLKNKNGEVIQELGALIGKTKPRETRQISATVGGVTASDVADIEITK